MTMLTSFHSSFEKKALDSEWQHSLNASDLKQVYLTADIDWAPEYAIDYMLEEIIKRDLKITLFATHRSPLLLQKYPNVELGVHPDYGRANIRNGLKYQLSFLMDIFPNAVGVRSHQNFFGQNTCNFAHEYGLKYEASNIQWRVPFLMPHRDYNDMVRIPYFWEDGIHADMRLPWDLEQLQINCAGLKVINFHPVFLYLNSPDDDYRREVVRNYSDLTTAPYADMSTKQFEGNGAFTYFKMILDLIVENNIKCGFLSDMA